MTPSPGLYLAYEEMRMDQDRVAEAAMKTLERHGVPVCPADIPGLYCGPTMPELTFNQLLSLACNLDPAFDPGRVK